jgi:hypothetical protein
MLRPRTGTAAPAICALATALSLVAPAHSVTAQSPSQTQDTVRALQAAQPGRRIFRATVAIDTARMLLRGRTPAETREIRLPPPLLRRLAEVRGRSFTALTDERPTPAGLRSAVVLRDGAAPRVVAETVRDMQLLRPADRGGIAVELRPAQSRKLLYSDNCKTVYNVPTAFTVGGEQVVMQPYETRTVKSRVGSYTIALGSSQFIVPKECGMVFEGSQSLIEYVIVRTP